MRFPTAFIPTGPISLFTPATAQKARQTRLAPTTLQDRLHTAVRTPRSLTWATHRHFRQTPNACTEGKLPNPAEGDNEPLINRPKKPEQTFFGLRLRTNGDVLKFGVVATIVPVGIKYILQATGTPDLLAGQMTTGFVSVFALLAWISSYVLRVGTKQMTYAQQLRDYEDQVIQKRYEELSEDELSALNEELDDEIKSKS